MDSDLGSCGNICPEESDGGRRNRQIRTLCDAAALEEMRREADQVFIHDKVCRYIVSLVSANRSHELISQGASPRASIALAKMARAMAWLNGEDYVTPLEVKALFVDVCRHRILPSRTARRREMGREEILREILDKVL